MQTQSYLCEHCRQITEQPYSEVYRQKSQEIECPTCGHLISTAIPKIRNDERLDNHNPKPITQQALNAIEKHLTQTS
ncbi:MAG: hypothetical protein ACU837_10695 [Gammaproteobacteria bacterium]